VLGIREFRALWAAELLSVLGDQLARVALAVLVFQRTSSAALTALTYALTFAPAVLGGALLSGLADRYPRRFVLVTTDVTRALLAGAMAIPVLPLPVLWTLVGLLSMAGAPFKAAQLALLPQILDERRYVVGLSLRQVTGQSAQLAGFASGGLLLVAVEPHVALAANAGTFLFSAAVILAGVRHRPAARHAAETPAAGPVEPPARDRRLLLPIVVLVCLAGLFVVPEGVAAPYGDAIGVGAFGVGLLMAADPLGSVLGALLTALFPVRPTHISASLLAAGSGVPLAFCALRPDLTVSMALWAVSGALSTAYLIQVQAIVVTLVPDHRRGRVMGRIATCLYTAQGLTIVAGGVAAQAVGPFRAVAGAGLLGVVIALCVGGWWRRVARSRRDLVAGSERGSEQRMVDSHISLFDTRDTSSQASCGHDLRRTTAHISLLRMTDTSLLPSGPAADAHISLLRTTDTSSLPAGHDESTGGPHISLLRTADTSSSPDRQHEPTGQAHISLLRTTGTSSSPDGQHEPTGGPHISLLRTADTSSSAGPHEAAGQGHISLLRTTDTSSPPDGHGEAAREGHISLFDMKGTSSQAIRSDDALGAQLAVGAFGSGKRRRGTRAPSLWRWALRPAGGRLLMAGRVATR
jgi:MFS family permease